jgi:hypothetical protein
MSWAKFKPVNLSGLPNLRNVLCMSPLFIILETIDLMIAYKY